VEYGACSTLTPSTLHCSVAPPFASVEESVMPLGEAGLPGFDPHDASTSASDTAKTAAVAATRRWRTGLLI
jgi:hypothetical protein